MPDNLLPQSYPPILEKTPVPIIPHPNQHQSDQPGLLGEEHNERHNNQQDDDNSDIAVSGQNSGQGGDSTDIETIYVIPYKTLQLLAPGTNVIAAACTFNSAGQAQGMPWARCDRPGVHVIAPAYM